MAGDHFSSTHPPLPPTTEDDRFNRLRLLRSRRVGISTFNRLIAEHGSAERALEALPDVAEAAGVSGYRICPEGVVEAEFTAARRAGARLLVQGEAPYPVVLCDLPDAPPLLWAIGDAELPERPRIALVGARNASSVGTRMARRLALGLGEAGFVVVSGLARGVDGAAHRAAMDFGTIAVLGGGVDVCYPAENAEIFDRIGQTGLRLSEQAMGLQPQARHFPARNRIISGLSQAVVVVEAASRSGSLITARTALDQGREVLAVPGSPLDGRAAGCNMLIRDGATLVRDADDIIEALSAPVPHVQHDPVPEIADLPAPPSRSLADAASLHSQILDRLGPVPVTEDQLLRDLSVSANDASPVLVELELDGEIRRDPGGLLARIN